MPSAFQIGGEIVELTEPQSRVKRFSAIVYFAWLRGCGLGTSPGAALVDAAQLIHQAETMLEKASAHTEAEASGRGGLMAEPVWYRSLGVAAAKTGRPIEANPFFHGTPQYVHWRLGHISQTRKDTANG